MQQFLRREGGEVRSLLLLRKYICQTILFICSYITFPIVYSFYFLFVGSRRNEFNRPWEGLRGRRQMATATQKVFLPAMQHMTYILKKGAAQWRWHQNKSQPSVPFPISFPKTIGFIPSGAKTQKIKRIDHNKCNVRASKNAEQAFSTQ